jgi:hypothetical protein
MCRHTKLLVTPWQKISDREKSHRFAGNSQDPLSSPSGLYQTFFRRLQTSITTGMTMGFRFVFS